MSLPGCFDMTSFSAGIWFHGWRQLTSTTSGPPSSSIRSFQGLTRVKESPLWFGKHSFSKQFNDAKLPSKSAIRKAAKTVIFFVALPLSEAPWGVSLWRTAVKAAVQQAGFLLSRLLTLSLAWNPEPKSLVRVATSWFAATKSASFHSYQPTRSVTNVGPRHEIQGRAQDPAVLYERQRRNNCLRWAGLGRWEEK